MKKALKISDVLRQIAEVCDDECPPRGVMLDIVLDKTRYRIRLMLNKSYLQKKASILENRGVHSTRLPRRVSWKAQQPYSKTTEADMFDEKLTPEENAENLVQYKGLYS